MELNENTYSYINSVFSQLEGITCALATFIENNKSEVSSYHYKTLNDIYNAMRNEFVRAVSFIKDEYDCIRKTAEKSVVIMKGSDESKAYLNSMCNEGESCINRLMIRCSSIYEIHESTENPRIPDADENVFKIFYGYRGLLDHYQIECPEHENDFFSSLFYSFYKTCVEEYNSLFEQFDIILQQAGVTVETKKKDAINAIVKKNKAIKEIAKKTGEFGLTVAEAAVPAGIAAAALSSSPLIGVVGTRAVVKATTALGIIGKKDVGDVVKEGIGLIATISENLGDIIPEDKNNKSAAREILRSFETYNQAIDIADQATGLLYPNASSMEKVVLGTMIAAASPQQIIDMKENATADVLTSSLELSNASIKFVKGLIDGGMRSAVLSGFQIPNKILGLVDKAAICVKKNEMPNKIPLVGKKLYKYGVELEEYEKAVEKFEYYKARGLPALKPKKPCWILHEICSKIDNTAEAINGMEMI